MVSKNNILSLLKGNFLISITTNKTLSLVNNRIFTFFQVIVGFQFAFRTGCFGNFLHFFILNSIRAMLLNKFF